MDDILFEYIRLGTSVKVTAIDTATGTEAVIIVPSGLSEKQMQQQALQKLLYILKKENQDQP